MADSMMQVIWTERVGFWTMFLVWLIGTPFLITFAFRAARRQAEASQSRWRTPVGNVSIAVLFLDWFFSVAVLLLPGGPVSDGESVFVAYVLSALVAPMLSLALSGRARVLAVCAGILNLIFISTCAVSK